MTALMLMCGGYAFFAAGGHHPLEEVALGDLAPLLAMAFTIQAINISLMTLFFKLDGREVNQIMTPSYALSDLIFVPAGVLAAVLFNDRAPLLFALFVALMSVFVLSFHGLDHYRVTRTVNGVPSQSSSARVLPCVARVPSTPWARASRANCAH